MDHLDGWRGLAILLVLQSHFLPWKPVDTGRLGVEVFFSLSGLLMSGLLFERRTPLGLFYKRRISRILPAFVLFVGVVHVWAAWRGAAVDAVALVSTLTFMRTYWPADPPIWNTGLPIGHLWSLNVEEHSYILLSLVTLATAVRSRVAIVLLCGFLTTVLIHAWYAHLPESKEVDFELRTEVAAALLLASAGYALVRHRVVAHVRPWMPLVAMAMAALAHRQGAHWWEQAVVSPVVLAFAVNHLAEAPGWLRELLSNRVMMAFGLWSYSLYLWQQPFAQSLPQLGSGAAFAATMTLGLVSYYGWERPWRVWLNQRWTRTP
ncbi:MAG: acyltransferase family protein [Aquabacterium sp.]